MEIKPSSFEKPQSNYIEVIKKPNINEAISMATAKINEALGDAKFRQTPTLFMLSGGSALKLLNGIDTENLGPNVTVTVLDERYSKDPDKNNFAQVVKNSFYNEAKEKGCAFIDTRVQAEETQVDLAERFNRNLSEWFRRNPEGKVIATVGVGPDGHTSGIMPYPNDPDNFNKTFNKGPEDFVVSYDATGKNDIPERVTTTPALLRKLSTAVVFVTGENKRDALAHLLANEGSINKTPARILKEIPGKVSLVTDLDISA